VCGVIVLVVIFVIIIIAMTRKIDWNEPTEHINGRAKT